MHLLAYEGGGKRGGSCFPPPFALIITDAGMSPPLYLLTTPEDFATVKNDVLLVYNCRCGCLIHPGRNSVMNLSFRFFRATVERSSWIILFIAFSLYIAYERRL